MAPKYGNLWPIFSLQGRTIHIFASPHQSQGNRNERPRRLCHTAWHSCHRRNYSSQDPSQGKSTRKHFTGVCERGHPSLRRVTLSAAKLVLGAARVCMRCIQMGRRARATTELRIVPRVASQSAWNTCGEQLQQRVLAWVSHQSLVHPEHTLCVQLSASTREFPCRAGHRVWGGALCLIQHRRQSPSVRGYRTR
jgi:alkylhydroperoxidase family enzyme